MPRTKKAKPVQSLYSVHPGVAMVQKWIADLPAKTGRTLEQWIALIRKEGPPEQKARRQWLKQMYGLGTNTAWWLAERAEGTGDMGMMEDARKCTSGRPSGTSRRCSRAARRACDRSTTRC